MKDLPASGGPKRQKSSSREKTKERRKEVSSVEETTRERGQARRGRGTESETLTNGVDGHQSRIRGSVDDSASLSEEGSLHKGEKRVSKS